MKNETLENSGYMQIQDSFAEHYKDLEFFLKFHEDLNDLFRKREREIKEEQKNGK